MCQLCREKRRKKKSTATPASKSRRSEFAVLLQKTVPDPSVMRVLCARSVWVHREMEGKVRHVDVFTEVVSSVSHLRLLSLSW